MIFGVVTHDQFLRPTVNGFRFNISNLMVEEIGNRMGMTDKLPSVSLIALAYQFSRLTYAEKQVALSRTDMER